MDDYTSGVINYPLKDLTDGRHHIRVKVWDVFNNSSESFTEFVVASSEKLVIEHLMNFPNPFSDSTNFFFDHNKKGEALFIELNIYDQSGKHMKRLSTKVDQAQDNFTGLTWYGDTNGGSPLKHGIYYYKIVVKTADGQEAALSERLVIIR
jgi:hypothetical protein